MLSSSLRGNKVCGGTSSKLTYGHRQLCWLEKVKQIMNKKLLIANGSIFLVLLLSVFFMFVRQELSVQKIYSTDSAFAKVNADVSW